MLEIYQAGGIEAEAPGAGFSSLEAIQALAYALQEETNSLDLSSELKFELFHEASDHLDDLVKKYGMYGRMVICQGTYLKPLKDGFGHIVDKTYEKGLMTGQYFGFVAFPEALRLTEPPQDSSSEPTHVFITDRYMLGNSIFIGTNQIDQGIFGKEHAAYFVFAPVESAGIVLERDVEAKEVLQALGEIPEDDELVREISQAVFSNPNGVNMTALDDIFGYIQENTDTTKSIDAYLMFLNFVSELKRQYLDVLTPVIYVPTPAEGSLQVKHPTFEQASGICAGFDMVDAFDINLDHHLATPASGKQLCITLENPLGDIKVSYIPTGMVKAYRKR